VHKLISLAALLAAFPVLADGPLPTAVALPAATPAPQDLPYPGTIRLSVDATDLDHHIFRIHESIPVQGGQPLTLLLPQWIPGNHAPSGNIAEMGGLLVRADGQRLAWSRDTVDDFAFHIQPPGNARTVEVDFQFLSAVERDQGRVVMTPEMLSLQWIFMSLYPAGYYARQIPVAASVTLPEGWGFGTALEVAGRKDGQVDFKTVPYDVLVDSPMLAGRYFRQIELDPGAARPVTLDIAADRPELLEIKPEQIEAHKTLVRQADLLFASRHFDHYDFLLSVTERLGGIGLEHHRSSEDGVPPGYFTEWDKDSPSRDLLPHEYTHSWNGKYRRPADLWTPNYNVPMQDSLLWVYEGQTQYWGHVLAARSGLVGKDLALQSLALTAAAYDNMPGRAWKPLQDTTNDPIVARRRPQPWRSWRRSEDYYSEGALIWLDADTLIRERSGGQRSLDDFARAFFGVFDGSFTELTYGFDDLVKALNTVEPYDWAGFLRTRLDGNGAAPLDGLARGGYKLVYRENPTEFQRQQMALRRIEDFTYSLGFTLSSKDATMAAVQWDSPAFKAGLTVGTKLLAVNGIAYDKDRLKEAVKAAKGGAPLALLVQNGDHYRTVAVDWRGGLRYPHLEKQGEGAASLDAILTPR
jgi:predicted metalloprotease with PDZ domain